MSDTGKLHSIAEKLNLSRLKRHIFLSADQTTATCCSREDGLAALDFLKKRLAVFRFSWKWRRRSPSKVMERTHEEATEALHAGREKQAIIGFHLKNPLEGYRRLTFMVLDADIVAVSPTSVEIEPAH